MRALLATAVLLLAGGLLLDWVPLNAQTVGFGFVLIAAALLF